MSGSMQPTLQSPKGCTIDIRTKSPRPQYLSSQSTPETRYTGDELSFQEQLIFSISRPTIDDSYRYPSVSGVYDRHHSNAPLSSNWPFLRSPTLPSTPPLRYRNSPAQPSSPASSFDGDSFKYSVSFPPTPSYLDPGWGNVRLMTIEDQNVNQPCYSPVGNDVFSSDIPLDLGSQQPLAWLQSGIASSHPVQPVWARPTGVQDMISDVGLLTINADPIPEGVPFPLPSLTNFEYAQRDYELSALFSGSPFHPTQSLGSRERSLHRFQMDFEGGGSFLSSESTLSSMSTRERRNSAPATRPSVYMAPMIQGTTQEFPDMRSESEDQSTILSADASVVADRVASNNVRRANHRRRIHQAKYECPVCRDNFTTKWSLQRHMNSHVGAKQFWCSHPAGCRMKFRNRSDLKRHEKVIHSD